MHIRNGRHSLPTQPKSRKEKTAWLYNNQFQNRRHKQLTKVRTGGFTALERSMAKQFATGGFNQVLECTNLTLAQTNKHKLSWWNNSNPHFSLTMLHAKAHKHIKHKKLIALQSKKAGTQWSYRDQFCFCDIPDMHFSVLFFTRIMSGFNTI